MKNIYLDVVGKMHSLYKSLVENPPTGYQFVTRGVERGGLLNRAVNIDPVYTFQDRILSKFMPVNLTKSYLEKLKKPPKGTDLTYATGHLVFRQEPWVVDLEFITQLAGYNLAHFKKYKGLIKKVLARRHCKRIICWTEAGKKTVLTNINCERFAAKVEVVHLAVPKKHFIKEYQEKKGIKLLFVGSANIPGEFEYKGGKEVLEAFSILRQRFPDLELVIRSDIPKKIKTKYTGMDKLRIIDNIIPWEELEQEFKSADIFLFPCHATPGLAFLDAMSYELPIITTDVWANPEMVTDGKTGFLISKSRKIQYYAENFVPIWDYKTGSRFFDQLIATDPTVVEELVKKATILIENNDLRQAMGKAGRQEIENGKFSIERRNQKMKVIFDRATDECFNN